jgi:hypothetical protein
MKQERDKDNEVQITLTSVWTRHATFRADARADSSINKTRDPQLVLRVRQHKQWTCDLREAVTTLGHHANFYTELILRYFNMCSF